jgi:hypothetical protein
MVFVGIRERFCWDLWVKEQTCRWDEVGCSGKEHGQEGILLKESKTTLF